MAHQPISGGTTPLRADPPTVRRLNERLGKLAEHAVLAAGQRSLGHQVYEDIPEPA